MATYDEGRRRLRVFLTVLCGVAVFTILNVAEYSVSDEELLQFLVVSLIVAGSVFATMSGIYWVLDGYGRGDERPVRDGGLDGYVLRSVCDRAYKEFSKSLIKALKTPETGVEHIDRMENIMLLNWRHSAVVYCYGLTCACAFRHYRKFVGSEAHKDLGLFALGKMWILSKKQIEAVGESLPPNQRIHESDAKHLGEMMGVVRMFVAHIQSGERGEPMIYFVEFLNRKVGFPVEGDVAEDIIEESHKILRNIDLELR